MAAVVRDARLRLDEIIRGHAQKICDGLGLAFAQPHVSAGTAAVAAAEALEIFVRVHAAFFTGFGIVSAKSVLSTAMSAEKEKSTP